MDKRRCFGVLQLCSANQSHMNSLWKLSTIVVFFLVLSTVDKVRALEYDVRAFGAKGDGRTLDTEAINKAIEAAAAAGGGTVRFNSGTYLSFRSG